MCAVSYVYFDISVRVVLLVYYEYISSVFYAQLLARGLVIYEGFVCSARGGQV
jgi:hypothetical protein